VTKPIETVQITGQSEKPTSAIYGQEYKASDGKTYVWSGTEYKVKA
jgi:hypothetical protein